MSNKCSRIGILLLIGVFSGFVSVRSISAQSPQVDVCEQLTQSVYRAYSDQEHTPEVLAYISSTARQARECYGETSNARRMWLIEQEVWSLDLLMRNQEACKLVEYFFEQFHEGATGEMRARRLLDRVRCRMLDGAYDEAVVFLDEAEGFREALPTGMQLSMDTDRSTLYMEAGLFTEASSAANLILRHPDIDLYPVVRARALENRAEASLFSEIDGVLPGISSLRGITSDLALAASLFGAEALRDRQAIVLASLGLALRLNGQELRAEEIFERASVAAEGEIKADAYILLSMARAARLTRLHSDAERLYAALEVKMDAGSYTKYVLDVAYEQALLEEQLGQLESAHDRLVGVVNTTIEPYSGAAIRAERIKQQARSHARLLELRMDADTQRMRKNAGIFVGIILFLFTVGREIHQRRLRIELGQASKRISKQEQEISNLKVELETKVKYSLPDNLDERRALYLKSIIEAPHLSADRLRDERPKLAYAVGRGEFENMRHLRSCIFALEKVIEGEKTHIDNPDGAVRLSLYRICKGLEVTQPKTLDEWREALNDIDFRKE